MLPQALQKFIETFSKLPAIGPRMATRLGFYLINLGDQEFSNLEKSFLELKSINRCPQCFFIKDKTHDKCKTCSNPKRNNKLIAVIEKETDLLSIEKSGGFEGIYLIIGQSSGRGNLTKTQIMRLKHLKALIASSGAQEIIIATSPTTFGDFLAEKIHTEIKDLAQKTTRLGRGLPTGGEVEFADEETLASALRRRD